MADHVRRRSARWWALLLGVLVAAWAPAPLHAHGSAAAMAQGPAVSGQPEGLQAAATLVTLGHGAWVPPHLLAWAPVSHRSHSWHRGTGRRQHRLSDPTPLPPASGSIPAFEPLNPQTVASLVRSAASSQGPGRCAASPRAPPAGN